MSGALPEGGEEEEEEEEEDEDERARESITALVRSREIEGD